MALFDSPVRPRGICRQQGKFVKVLAALEAGVPLRDIHAILDVGAGAGVYPLVMAILGKTSHAVDTWAEYDGSNPMGSAGPLLARLVEQGVATQVADFMKAALPYRDGSFDLCFCMDVIEHVPRPKVLLDEISRVTKERGFLVLETPNAARLSNRLRLLAGRSVHHPLTDWYHSDPFFGHCREYTISELRQMLQWSGLEVIGLSTHNAALIGRRSVVARGYRALSWWGPSLRNEILVTARKRP